MTIIMPDAALPAVAPACETCASPTCIAIRGYRCPQASIEVAVESFPAFEKAFRRLSRRAEKLGAELPTYEVVTEYTVVSWARDAFTKTRWSNGGTHVKAIRVAGPRPKFAGWTLLATLEPLETKNEAGVSVYVNLIKSVPGAGDLPEALRQGRQCDHCQKVRARAETFAVRHDDGRIMRVGRQCIGDFLGGQSPANVALAFAFATDCAAFGGSADEDGFAWGPRTPRSFPLVTLLGLVVREIEENGWLSRTAAKEPGRGGQPTADAALDRLLGNPFRGIRPEKPSEEEIVTATKAIAWAYSTLLARSDYDHNVQAIARSGDVTHKTLGIAASIFGAYERAEAREVERRKAAAGLPPSQHVGTVKARVDVTLTVERIFDVDNEWGATHIHVMTDDAGNVFKWFASAERLEIGERYHVRGTVKSHGEYKGRKETVLSRCGALPIAEWDAFVAREAAAKVAKAEERAKARAEKRAAKIAESRLAVAS